MKVYIHVIFLLIIGQLFGCNEPVYTASEQATKNGNVKQTTKQDTFYYYLNDSDLFNFIEQAPGYKNKSKNLVAFYKRRDYAFAWINSMGLNEYARNFMNLLNQEPKENRNEFAFYHDELHTLYNHLTGEEYKLKARDSLALKLELLITDNFFEYAERNWRGLGDNDVRKVNWFIDRKKLNYEQLLDSVLKNSSQNIFSFEPVYRQYGLLKKQLQRYYAIEKRGGWPMIQGKLRSLKIGDTDTIITVIKEELYVTDDLTLKDTTELFNENLEVAVKGFQKRHGLKVDGIIAGKTVQALQVGVHERIQQILINMERCKWVPAEQKGDYIAVNIPDFKMLVYRNDTFQWSCKVIVGKSKAANNTVIFNDNLEYIVFNPYWSIPKTILIKETLPAIKKNPSYLAHHEMEIINGNGDVIPASSIEWNKYRSNFPFTIRQKPGKNNSLGRVKFYFPNTYDIYLHDTPEKSLFNETTRAFSHGCIRVEEPYKLAEYLLRDDPEWTTEKINAAMIGDKQIFVKLKSKVPVFIAYFTAWIDKNGTLNFRDDIYHHDEKMKNIMFGN